MPVSSDRIRLLSWASYFLNGNLTVGHDANFHVLIVSLYHDFSALSRPEIQVRPDSS